jgi:hypothetical protein
MPEDVMNVTCFSGKSFLVWKHIIAFAIVDSPYKKYFILACDD